MPREVRHGAIIGAVVMAGIGWAGLVSHAVAGDLATGTAIAIAALLSSSLCIYLVSIGRAQQLRRTALHRELERLVTEWDDVP